MHPHSYYAALWDVEKRDEVFVIMSFDPAFDDRWQSVIRPAIQDDLGLKANRVDERLGGDSIVTDILDGIGHARLVLADITSASMCDRNYREWPQRNGNVMWELGIAHTVRLPEEVIAVRTDGDELIFDLSTFRAFMYDPSASETARHFVAGLLRDRLRSIDQTKSLQVRRALASLHPVAVSALLGLPLKESSFAIPPNMMNALVYPTLFDYGILRHAGVQATPSQSPQPSDFTFLAQVTPFGYAVLDALAREMGTSLEKLRFRAPAAQPGPSQG